jgi:hypothetical protein
MRCEDCEKFFVEALYEELDSESRSKFEKHLSECRACSAEFKRMQATLRIMDRRERPDPGQAYWEGYWNRLNASMERPQPRGMRRWLTRRVLGGSRPAVTWAYRAAAAVVLVALGAFVGRTFLPTRVVERQGPTAPERQMVVQPASTGQRAMQYLESSQVLLLALVNYDPENEGVYAADLSAQRRLSRRLVGEAAGLKEELGDPRHRRLRELVSDLELILMQIANLEGDDDLGAVEFIRSSVNEKDVLLKINLEQVRIGEDVGQSESNAGESDELQRSI